MNFNKIFSLKMVGNVKNGCGKQYRPRINHFFLISQSRDTHVALRGTHMWPFEGHKNFPKAISQILKKVLTWEWCQHDHKTML